MSRALKAEDLRVWARVAASIRPLPGRKPPVPPPEEAPPSAAPVPGSPGPASAKPAGPSSAERPGRPPRTPGSLQELEPGRLRRLTRGRDPLDGRIDLHGYGQDEARRVLTGYLLSAHAEGRRAVLVITGKGSLGEGVLRRRLPDWLNEAPLRALVAGLSPADRRHGGAGAFYIALKRRAP